MSDIFILEQAQLFVGDDNPENGKHLSIENLTLPNLEYTTVEHAGGGANMALEVNMGQLKPLQLQFKLVGFDRDTYRLCGVGSNEPRNFTARGVLRVKQTGKAWGVVATIRGCMGKMTADQFQRSSLLGHDHTIVEVVRYRLTVAGEEWFDVDFYGTRRSRFGVDELAESRALLGMS